MFDNILRNSVTVARQTLTLFVGVRIPIPQPKNEALIMGALFLYLFMYGIRNRNNYLIVIIKS